MSADPVVLPAVRCGGLHLDSLGHYLAALGLLGIATREWPQVRGAWREEAFWLVGGPKDIGSLTTAVAEVLRSARARSYYLGWKDAQKGDSNEARATKKGVTVRLVRWRSDCGEQECDLVDAHLVPAARLCFNPVLGTGGNSGNRDFAEGWSSALEEIGWPDDKHRADLDIDLAAFLAGDQCQVRKPKQKKPAANWNAKSWFSAGIPPWAMALACEGLPMLSGKASRRLGARSRRLGAFPFCTEAAAAIRENEAGRVLAEMWAPVWSRPLASAELAALFARGRAELGGRGAATASSFAVAIMRRGVDAGIVEFRRFLLNRTTSSQTFESSLARPSASPGARAPPQRRATPRSVPSSCATGCPPMNAARTGWCSAASEARSMKRSLASPPAPTTWKPRASSSTRWLRR